MATLLKDVENSLFDGLILAGRTIPCVMILVGILGQLKAREPFDVRPKRKPPIDLIIDNARFRIVETKSHCVFRFEFFLRGFRYHD